MKLFKNINGGQDKGDYELLSGADFLFKSAFTQGVKNIFIENTLIQLLPELSNLPSLKSYSNPELFWTSIYSLSLTNQRVMALAQDQYFLNFTYLEKYFIHNFVNGGTVLFLLKKEGIKNLSIDLNNIFPVYNFYGLDNFIDFLPYYFELSEKLKLPVLIYINDSVLYEYRTDENIKTSERTEIKPILNIQNDHKKPSLLDLKQNFQFYKNTGKLLEFFNGETHANLILTDAINFHWIAENPEMSKNSDIILFNLLNPIFIEGFIEILKNECKDYYENIYIFDEHSFLRYQLNDIIKNNNLNLRFANLKFLSNKDNKGFCLDNFTLSEIAIPASFCVGCNLYTFFHKLKNKNSLKNDILIGDDVCFSLLKSSALKYSFVNCLSTENPLYFILNLEPDNFNRKFYVFISSSNFYDHINIALTKIKTSNNLTFIIYKSIHDFKNNFKDILNNPLISPIQKVVLKSGTRLRDLKADYDAPLIFIDNNCETNAKIGRNLNYAKYLNINTNICDKFECKLCYQETKCPAIKVSESGEIIIDGSSCNICNLCVDICPHNAIKLKKRKKIKIKKSLESKINLS